jgi:acyl-lipid omega-6 desaturase (Delta-12 desaturase)
MPPDPIPARLRLDSPAEPIKIGGIGGFAARGRRIAVNKPDWLVAMKRFEKIDTRKSLRELLNSFIPYAAIFAAMCLAYRFGFPYWTILLMSVPAAGFLVRIFIILHDCGHYSFSNEPRLNSIFGYICGILTFASFPDFRRTHAIHHATVANLDKRGVGDVPTMTVEEYQRSGLARRFYYRTLRNPVFLFLIYAPIGFVVVARFPQTYNRRADVIGTLATDLALAALIFLAAQTIGIVPYVAVQLPITYISTVVGTWLFFVQHQFKGVYWVRDPEWDQVKASLQGASFYDLPPILRWFTGNIGYHHIHHLRPRIPNYMLKEVQESVPEVQTVAPISLRGGFASLGLDLYDEELGSLVSFKEARAKIRAR